MIEFVLDVMSELSLAIARYETSDCRDQDIRAFMAFYDAIKSIESQSERLIAAFEEYITSYSEESDPSNLRSLIRRFSRSIYEFVEKFRSLGFRNADPLGCFSRELAEGFVTVGRIGSVFCRSLIEVSSPDICINQALSAMERKYCLRVVDYQRCNYSVEAVQRQWALVFANAGMSNLLWGDRLEKDG
jgi:hypothetical protein